MLATCFSTVPSEITSASAMARSTDLGHEGEHLFLPVLSAAMEAARRDAPMSWVTTSGSRAVPPEPTRTSASTKSLTSATRSFNR